MKTNHNTNLDLLRTLVKIKTCSPKRYLSKAQGLKNHQESTTRPNNPKNPTNSSLSPPGHKQVPVPGDLGCCSPSRRHGLKAEVDDCWLKEVRLKVQLLVVPFRVFRRFSKVFPQFPRIFHGFPKIFHGFPAVS